MKKKEEKKLIIDVRGALLILERKTGVKKTVTDLAKEYGTNNTTFQNWDKDAPKSIKFVVKFLKYNPELTFNDLVKEV
jgi:hypothetical protein